MRRGQARSGTPIECGHEAHLDRRLHHAVAQVRVLSGEVFEIAAVPGHPGDAEARAELDIGAFAVELDTHA